ncbi:SAYSvFN domain-containing protein 1-like [Antedon mediterranea]|uniref:SAYSvFN domain-containing protein 1-like n=1 Tax=Antedon mediterranea TaxID=105859 RepID=UPI003AF86495
MSGIEQQLAEYRARKRRENPEKHHGITDDTANAPVAITPTRPMILPNRWINNLYVYVENTRLVRAIINNNIISNTTFLKVLLWLLLFALFIHIEFGVIFFMLSIFYLMYITMTVGIPRRYGELSAYSVFNRDFERIDGTFTAEQFERELLHGAGSIH